MNDLNSVTLLARLTRDPELRHLQSGQSVCDLRLAFNKSVKNGDQWKDQGCFVKATVWGTQAESCAKYLTKGRQVAIKGRLDWRSYEHEGQKREDISIVAEQVQFIGGEGQGSTPAQSAPAPAPAASQHRSDESIPF